MPPRSVTAVRSSSSWRVNSPLAGEPPASASAASTTAEAVYVDRSPVGMRPSSGNTVPVQ